MIPSLTRGHLPPGRYRATFEEVEQRFVRDEQFADSKSRAEIWDGFRRYLLAWRHVCDALEVEVLHAVWVAGSFVSGEPEPSDIDVTPILDREAKESAKGRAGMGQLKRLVQHREQIVERFHVEPFPMMWDRIDSTLHAQDLPVHQQSGLTVRGGLDDWWQRIKPPGDPQAPQSADAFAARGYLEVTW